MKADGRCSEGAEGSERIGMGGEGTGVIGAGRDVTDCASWLGFSLWVGGGRRVSEIKLRGWKTEKRAGGLVE